MRDNGWELLLSLVIIVACLVWGGRKAYAESVCNKAGYPTANVTWTLAAYCVKRVDQTDTVVPLSEAK